MEVTDALAQARRNATEDKLALVVLHEGGQRHDGQWHDGDMVVLRLDDFVEWFGTGGGGGLTLSATRAVRLMYIKELLMEQPYSVQELSELCGVTPKTIRLDLLDLQMEPLCVPLVVEGGRWRIFDWRHEL